jgi:hypothetical protein
MSNTGYKSITRIDSERKRMFGYFARVAWRKQMVRKWFSDSQYDDALAAAIEWRDETEIRLGKPRTENSIRATGIDPRGVAWERPSDVATGPWDMPDGRTLRPAEEAV